MDFKKKEVTGFVNDSHMGSSNFASHTYAFKVTPDLLTNGMLINGTIVTNKMEQADMANPNDSNIWLAEKANTASDGDEQWYIIKTKTKDIYEVPKDLPDDLCGYFEENDIVEGWAFIPKDRVEVLRKMITPLGAEVVVGNYVTVTNGKMTEVAAAPASGQYFKIAAVNKYRHSGWYEPSYNVPENLALDLDAILLVKA